jgi:hypothetical protein
MPPFAQRPLSSYAPRTLFVAVNRIEAGEIVYADRVNTVDQEAQSGQGRLAKVPDHVISSPRRDYQQETAEK